MSNDDAYGLYPAAVAEEIYQSVVMGGSPLLSEAMAPPLKGNFTVEPYKLYETLPPYDWWRAINPETGVEYVEADFPDIELAPILAPLYAKATKLALGGTDTKFPAQLDGVVEDDVPDGAWLYVKNRDPNWFAMKGDIVWCIETDASDIIPVSGGRKSIDGIVVNSAKKADDILTNPTDVEYSEVYFLGRNAPNAAAVVTTWSECIPNMYESLDVDKYVSCRVARAGGIWVYESIGCEPLRTQSFTPDADIFGSFDSRARYEELYPSYYSQELEDVGS